MATTTIPHTTDARLRLRRISGDDDAPASFAEDVRRGLTSTPKRLFPKYFYDALGSALFDAICQLPEYYLTRAEDEILARHADDIIKLAREGFADQFRADDSRAARSPERIATLVEFGSGSSAKTRRVIEALLRHQDQLTYLPIDISTSALETGARALLESYPRISVEAYAGDYDAALAHLREQPAARPRAIHGRTLALFLGSNIGNFDPTEAEEFLRRVRSVLRTGDALLVGADLKKDAAVLEAAYDDPLGVTAAFNLNLLARINRELGGDFDVRAFRHVARYDETVGRVEMHLESTRAQVVRIRSLDLEISFDTGERVHTENSHKYDADALSALAARAGFVLEQTWYDSAHLFSDNLLTAAGGDAK